MPEEREPGHGRQPLSKAVGLVEVVATISFSSLWCWAELSPQALPDVGTGASVLPAKLQRWEPPGQSEGRRGEERLMAEMSFTSTAGSKKKGFV